MIKEIYNCRKEKIQETFLVKKQEWPDDRNPGKRLKINQYKVLRVETEWMTQNKKFVLKTWNLKDVMTLKTKSDQLQNS